MVGNGFKTWPPRDDVDVPHATSPSRTDTRSTPCVRITYALTTDIVVPDASPSAPLIIMYDHWINKVSEIMQAVGLDTEPRRKRAWINPDPADVAHFQTRSFQFLLRSNIISFVRFSDTVIARTNIASCFPDGAPKDSCHCWSALDLDHRILIEHWVPKALTHRQAPQTRRGRSTFIHSV
jgi:hypothetical protein